MAKKNDIFYCQYCSDSNDMVFHSKFFVKKCKNMPMFLKNKQILTIDSLEYMRNNYCVSEMGAFFFYLPTPRSEKDRLAWEWLEALRSCKMILGDPRHILSKYAGSQVREQRENLFDEMTESFEIYRIDSRLRSFSGAL